MRVKMRLLEWPPNRIWPYKARKCEQTDMHTGKTPCEDEGWNWGDVSISQGTPEIADKSPEAGDTWDTFSLRSQKSAPLLPWPRIPRLQNCETGTFCYSIHSSVVPCDCSPRKLTSHLYLEKKQKQKQNATQTHKHAEKSGWWAVSSH